MSRSNQMLMLGNYLRIALRHIGKNPLYSAINILGLAVGLASCILIAMLVRDELSYDQHWQDAERIHRLNTTLSIPGREPFVTVVAAGPVKHALASYFPSEIEAVTRFHTQVPVVRYQDKSFSEEVHWTDPETADMFDLHVLYGDLSQALNDNASLAINRSFAERHFGDVDAIGEVINLKVFDLNRDFQIAAVFEDLPHNTILDFQALAMIDENDWRAQPFMFDHWFSINNNVFFKLRPEASIAAVDSGLAKFTDTNIQIPSGTFGEGEVSSSDYIMLSSQRLTDIQLDPAGMGEMKPTGDRRTVLMFAAIAVLTLVIACINFMNLATARSMQRSREVALRKVMGARRGQLIVQFLGESTLIAVLSLLLGLALVEMLLPIYSNFLGKELLISYADSGNLLILAVLVILVGVLAGLYPALVLSAFQPARVLKANRSLESQGSTRLRNALVVFQFSVSIALGIATSTVYSQMQYAISMDPGFEKDGLLTIAGASRPGAADQQQVLLQRLRSLADVKSVTKASEAPFSTQENNTSVTVPDSPEVGSLLLGTIRVDYDFIETMDVDLAAGRNYSRDFALDAFPEPSVREGERAAGNVLINEAAVRRIGFGSPEQALGKHIVMGVGEDANGETVEALLTVVGVVSDMHWQSLRREIRPELYLTSEDPQPNVVVRFNGNPRRVGAAVEQLWLEMFPDVPIEYDYTDDVAVAEFEQERQIATMLGLFAALAIIIACLGLYGLASFTAQRRVREIGIRRVLGASVLNIIGLLLWQFSKPVLLANIIAWPIALWSMMRWLEGFPYRIDDWMLLPLCLIAGAVAIGISWLTVGGNAARIALRSPVQALRYE